MKGRASIRYKRHHGENAHPLSQRNRTPGTCRLMYIGGKMRNKAVATTCSGGSELSMRVILRPGQPL